MKRFISSALALTMVASVVPVSAMAAKTPKASNLAAAEVVDLGWAKYLTVRSVDGESLKDCTLTVDGVDITEAVTPVTTDGSIVKWEVTSNKHAKLVVDNGTESQTIRLRNGRGAAPQVVTDQTPDYFLMNGPLYVWDYHLTNYDDAGNVRYAPTQTTIGLDAVSGATAYSRDAIVYEDENALPYFVKGEVSLEFNYETAEDKAYVDGITDVDLVAANEYKNTLNDELHYEIVKDVAHGERVNAVIKVAIGQKNFTSNGRYNLRVTSNGAVKLFPIHLVAETVPSMAVTNDHGYYGDEVHFRISDMTYGVTCPIYRVELTNPDGQTETLAKFDDWFLHGDLLVLYNDITNHFPETGSYTVKVWANGFQSFNYTFWQKAVTNRDHQAEAVTMAAAPVTYDAISTASVGGGSSSGGGSDGGDSKFMNANLIVDSDLIANAKLAIMMGVNDAAAQGISDRWDSMNVLYAFDQGAESVYDFDAYYNAVNTAKKYLTFAQYTASKDAVATLNRPYAVKQVLEDNLLGETTGFIEAVGLSVPAYTVELVDNAAVITFADADYLAAAVEGRLTLNGNSLAMQNGKDFTVEGNVLTLNNVDYGKNVLSIRTAAYQTARIAIDRVYPVEPVELSANDITKGEEIIITCAASHENGKCDFMEHITGIQIIAPNGYRDDVMPDGAESVFEKIGYTVSTNLVNNIVIGKDTLLQKCFLNEDGTFAAGAYKIVITAEYYGDIAVTVNVADAQIEGTAAVPTVAGIEHIQKMMDNYFRVSFLEEDVEAYLNAITSITLNGVEAQKVYSFWNDTNSYKFSNDPAYGGADKFIDFTADCFDGKNVNVVIKAEGYEDMAFTVENGQFDLVLAAAPEVAEVVREGGIMGQYDRMSFKGDVADYLAAITSVTLNGKEAKQVYSFWNDTNSYKFSNDPVYGGADKFIDFTTDCFAGEVVLVIKATGYEDLTMNLVDGQIEIPSVAAPSVKAVTEVGGFMKHYTVSFDTEEAAAVAYLEAVTAITVDGKPLKEVTSFWGESMGYKISNDPVYGGAYQFLDFTADCYGKTVVVSAEGYADLTFELSK